MRAIHRRADLKKQLNAMTAELSLSRAALRKKKIAIVASEFNQAIVEDLLKEAVDALIHFGVLKKYIRVIRVPGAFELPVMSAYIIASKPHVDAVIALGVLIRGQTTQYQLIAQAVLHGFVKISIDTLTPITCGLIVAETAQQARARAGGGSTNRGREAAIASLKLLLQFEMSKIPPARKNVKTIKLLADTISIVPQPAVSMLKRSYSDA